MKGWEVNQARKRRQKYVQDAYAALETTLLEFYHSSTKTSVKQLRARGAAFEKLGPADDEFHLLFRGDEGSELSQCSKKVDEGTAVYRGLADVLESFKARQDADTEEERAAWVPLVFEMRVVRMLALQD